MNVLADTFSRVHTYLRISVTDRCNMRCRYCVPPEGIDFKTKDAILSYDEITRVAGIFARMGITKIRLTGGEPLIRKELPRLVSGLTRIPGIRTVGMTSNGVLIHEYAEELFAAGLEGLNISLDTLRPDRFEHITHGQYFGRVLRGIETAVQTGFRKVKLNVVVMKGVNDDELSDFVHYASTKKLDVRFIEYMPFSKEGKLNGYFMPWSDMRSCIERRFSVAPVDNTDGDVAREFRINGTTRRVGFITSMSHSFCGSCNRVRLTADGSIKACLFHPAENNLRALMRTGVTDEILEYSIRSAIRNKPIEHQPVEMIENAGIRTMIQIGG